jgi:FKBP-type peptidyl-prolyl cis-trans isomerase FkpA
MRKLVLCLISIAIFSIGCKKNSECPKDDNLVAPLMEEQALAAYLNANGIVATKHANNMYYQIITPGTGGHPDLCSSVTVSYTGRVNTSSSTFDDGTNKEFKLGVLISGWKKGIPLIQKGGRIKLFIPPSLGYGTREIKDGSGAVLIPSNSITVFDITLVDFR